LGSFLKQELRSHLNTGSYQNNHYQSGNYNSDNYQGQYQNVQRYNSYPTQQGMQYIRQPDGSMKTYGPNGGIGTTLQMHQPAPRINGDVVGFVTGNMPVDVSGSVDSLMPKELHDKAYGPELQRFAPMNGAEGYHAYNEQF
jgi:hypothetical protein